MYPDSIYIINFLSKNNYKPFFIITSIYTLEYLKWDNY